MVGLLQLWLVMETVYTILRAAYVALFSNNSHMVGWVWRLAAKGSPVAMQLLQALALRIKVRGTLPLTPLHIAGDKNKMTGIL